MNLNVPFSPQPKPKHLLKKAEKERKARLFRDAVWKRDRIAGSYGNESGLCVKCGAYLERGDGHSEVDHIKPKSTHPELAYDPANGRLTCKPCNLWFKRNPLQREVWK